MIYFFDYQAWFLTAIDIGGDGRILYDNANPDPRIWVRGWFDSMFGHWTPAATIREEMEAAGYRLDAEPPLPRQSFLIFR